jgi:hypothetical protein
LETKKDIVIALGSYPLLKGKNLSILINKWFKRVQKEYPIMNAEYQRFGLGNLLLSQKKKAARAAIISVWGA